MTTFASRAATSGSGGTGLSRRRAHARPSRGSRRVRDRERDGAPRAARDDRRHRERSCDPRATRWRPARSTSRTALMLAAVLEAAGAAVAPARGHRGHGGGPRGVAREGARRRTSSSRRVGSPSGRTTSCAARSGATRRRGGLLGRCDAARASRSHSAAEGGRSSSACRATPCRPSSAALLFVRPALLALTGHPDPAPPFRPARSCGADPAAPGARRIRPCAGDVGRGRAL